MGYAPITHNARNRREFLRWVPGPDSLWKKVDCEIEVVPFKHKWEWRVRLLMDGRPDPFGGGTWRRPTPYSLRGRCRDQGDAWARARAIVNDVRAIRAATEVSKMRSHTERVPL